MGLAALFVGILIALAIAVSIAYGTVVGLVRAGKFLWHFLVADKDEALAAREEAIPNQPCWEAHECPPSVREVCPAYIRRNENLPCWLTNLQADGRLRVSCLTCERFSAAELAA